ncbi:ribose 5-phosphate isomerase B [Candidatus Woesearchaeota archaeon]|nr:ribose 5-phosphate isomerase B [Candidatus Woesearchaeota archaeon]MBW3016909.1 ribose 5-phosphate isomerase B [Candidatus Woesearchaeota archaeon]
MKVIIGADHAGFKLKEELKKFLNELGYDVDDVGTENEESTDYPVYADKVVKKVLQSHENRGIMVCRTGIGSCITVNRFHEARGALAYSEESAKLSREHNNANILCLGSIMDWELAKKMAKIFLETNFSEEERHKRRLKEIEDLF